MAVNGKHETIKFLENNAKTFLGPRCSQRDLRLDAKSMIHKREN